MKGQKIYSKADVAECCKNGQLLVVVDSGVYNVSKWVKYHPGGEVVLRSMAGQDCTEVFKAFHRELVRDKVLRNFLVGQLAEDDRPQEAHLGLSKDIRKLEEKLKKEGMFERDVLFYIRQMFTLTLLLSLSVGLAWYGGSKLTLCVAAVLLGFFYQQLAFVGHDVGHHTFTCDSDTDNKAGLIFGNLLSGISMGWWRYNHNMHHVVTNSVDYDPDIQHLPVFAVTSKFFSSIYSKFYKRTMLFDSAAKKLVSYQHILFYPVMSLARFNLYVQSFIYVFTNPEVKYRKAEFLTLVMYWIALVSMCWSLPSGTDAFLYLMLSHMTAGIIHVQITLSHFAMDVYEGIPQEEHGKNGYLISQLLTTLNIDCSPWLDFFHGGLQFQIEHHLFPHVCRSKLRKVRPMLKDICSKYELPYHEVSFWRANYDVLRALKRTAKEAWELSPMILDGLNARG